MNCIATRLPVLVLACAELLVMVFVDDADAQSAPNILIISADDVGFNEIGFQGNTSFQTPNLDALARAGTRFTNAYDTAPLCSPSRAGLITGRYQQRIGHEFNLGITLPAEVGFPVGEPTLGNELQQLGYQTGVVGKWHLGITDGVFRPLDRGFDEFYGFLDGFHDYFQEHTEDALRIYRNNTPDPSWADEGKYLTDVFGEEAAGFVDRNSASPFFLLLSFNGIHSPLEATQEDLDAFPSLTGEEKTRAAMMRAVDRAIGMVLDKLDEKGLTDDTLIIFSSDNGGQLSFSGDNGSLRDGKGTMYEGGIRTPLLISGPGVAADSVVDVPVSLLDIVPTVLTAAGGSLPTNLDGSDLSPYLSASPSTDPLHDSLQWRLGDTWAIRQGDWKLVQPSGQPPGATPELYNLAADPGETSNVAAADPARVDQMLTDFTVWEAQLDLPRWSQGGVPILQANHFNWRQFDFTDSKWSESDVWQKDSETGDVVSLTPYHAYANTVLEFHTEATHDYVSTNDMARQSGLPFMMNEFLFAGDYSASENHVGTINGNDVLLVRNLAGQAPTLRLDATHTGGSGRFTFDLDLNLILLNDLSIEGDGTENFNINGNLRQMNGPHSITKTGSSTVRFRGFTSLTGDFAINSGQVEVDGPGAGLMGFNQITIAPGAKLVLKDGLVDTEVLDNSAGTFQFDGGTFHTVHVLGSLVNNGGTFSPGHSPGAGIIDGDYLQNSGVLLMEITGSVPGIDFDTLEVGGLFHVGGTLRVVLVNANNRPFVPTLGDSWDLFDFDNVSGRFNAILLPNLSDDLYWNTSKLLVTGELSVAFFSVPEPSMLLLMLGGLGAISLSRRPRARRRAC